MIRHNASVKLASFFPRQRFQDLRSYNMDKVLLCALTCLLLRCQGLELSMDHKTPLGLGRRAPCGVLVCVEKIHMATNATASPRGDTDVSESPRRVAQVSDLRVFRLETAQLSGDNAERRRVPLAAVTAQQPRLTRVSNGVRVDGGLEQDRAVLTLTFSKQEDCRADFVCQSRGVDTEHRDFSSTSHLLQRPRESRAQGNELAWTPGMAGQILHLVYQLDSKLAAVGSAVVSWEEEMNRLKDKLQRDVDSLQANLNAKTDRLEDKLQNMWKDMNTRDDRFDDKLESLRKGTEAAANRLEDKLESTEHRLEAKLEAAGDQDGEPGPCQSDVREIIKEEINTGIVSLDEKVSTVKSGLAQFGTELNLQLQALYKQGDTLVKNLSFTSAQGSACRDEEDVGGELAGGFTSLENSLHEKFLDLSSSINASAAETRSLVNGQASQRNLTITGELKSSLTELLAPTNCFRGMASSASLAPSMYSVIQPSDDNSLVSPVLCDTFTDGGGWIVIQRRVTGDVNFYRGWDDYKHGFGTLDGDFWLGNENIHAITSQADFELRIDMRYKGKSAFAHYSSFSVGDERSNYALHVAHYSGTAGDSILGHDGAAFTTHDKDNDASSVNCAVDYVGAWWYTNCHASNLNGQWRAGSNRGPRWNSLTGAEPVSYTEMKVRRVIGESD